MLIFHLFQPEPLPEWYIPSDHEKMQAKVASNPVRKVGLFVCLNLRTSFLQGFNRIALKGRKSQATGREVTEGQKELVSSQVKIRRCISSWYLNIKVLSFSTCTCISFLSDVWARASSN